MSNENFQRNERVGAIPTLVGVGRPTPVLGELRDLPTRCKDKAQRKKRAESLQASNIKNKFIKGAALVLLLYSITTTKHKFEIKGPNTRDLNFVATWLRY